MQIPNSINEYLREWAPALGDRIVQMYPALQTVSDNSSPLMATMLRKPFAAQELAVMGLVKRWRDARTAALVAECGTGKTLMSLGAIHCHSESKPFTALAMVPPQLVKKWCREILKTLPRVRVFLIDGLRATQNPKDMAGVNEVRLRNGEIIREGLRTTLTELRLRKARRSARSRWRDLCSCSAVFVVGRDRAKLGYYWKHTYQISHSGRFNGCLVNPDTGEPVTVDDLRLCSADFKNIKLSEVIGDGNGEGQGVSVSRRQLYSPLWQADRDRTRRYAPIEFIGRYMPRFFDYGIADEVHELKGDTAQGNALGTLAACADRIAVLTGTLLGGYADELFNILFRLEARKMISQGFEHGEGGSRRFCELYGVLETSTVIEPDENACSKARVTVRTRRRPGASPLLFGRFLMSLAAFVSLEDISSELPPYVEEVVPVDMDPQLREVYARLEDAIKRALQLHPGNPSVTSVAMNALMLYPDRPFHLGALYGYDRDPETKQREKFVIVETEDLDENHVYAKERRLVEEVRRELSRGRRCQIYAVYTKKRDVTQRLERILSQEGIRVAVLTTEVKPENREAWYERQLASGIEAVICHPKLVQTGLDLIDFPTIIYYQTGTSIYTLRQASRRSWRIGQRRNVKVIFLHYQNSVQEILLRLMGKKLLISLAMEGKFSSDGLQAIDDDGDLFMEMARELVTEKGIGESADSVWRNLQRQHCDTFGGRAADTEDVQPEDDAQAAPVPELVFSASQNQPSHASGLLALAASGHRGRKSKGSESNTAQMALF
jgi:hypothetical protein